MIKVKCPNCFYNFEVDNDTLQGEIVFCPDCETGLEVTRNNHHNKIILEIAPTEEEDWGE